MFDIYTFSIIIIKKINLIINITPLMISWKERKYMFVDRTC